MSPADFYTRSAEPRADWPDAVLAADPAAMHPRAVAMAEAMREGAATFKELKARDFTNAEIIEFHRDAEALATSLSARQVAPGADLLAEMVEKAKAAIHNQPPRVKGAPESQAIHLAWGRYCAAHAANVLDPWSGQRERCLILLTAFFRATPAGPAIISHVVNAVAETLEARH